MRSDAAHQHTHHIHAVFAVWLTVRALRGGLTLPQLQLLQLVSLCIAAPSWYESLFVSHDMPESCIC